MCTGDRGGDVLSSRQLVICVKRGFFVVIWNMNSMRFRATGKRFSNGATRRSQRFIGHSAMTLMEVLICLALILISMSIVIPNLMRLYEADAANRAVSDVSSILGQARNMAIDNANVYLFRCYPGESTFEILEVERSVAKSRQAGSVSEPPVVMRSVMQGELSSDFRFVSSQPVARGVQDTIGVYWLPDGSASSQSFGLMDRSGKRHWIGVDAITGQLSRLRQSSNQGTKN